LRWSQLTIRVGRNRSAQDLDVALEHDATQRPVGIARFDLKGGLRHALQVRAAVRTEGGAGDDALLGEEALELRSAVRRVTASDEVLQAEDADESRYEDDRQERSGSDDVRIARNDRHAR